MDKDILYATMDLVYANNCSSEARLDNDLLARMLNRRRKAINKLARKLREAESTIAHLEKIAQLYKAILENAECAASVPRDIDHGDEV